MRLSTQMAISKFDSERQIVALIVYNRAVDIQEKNIMVLSHNFTEMNVNIYV